MNDSTQPLHEYNLEGQVAIVTGGGHGLGKAYVEALVEEGAKVVIAELNTAAADQVVKELSLKNNQVLSVTTDVSSPESVSNMVDQVIGRFGAVDILINNASIFQTVPISRLPFDEISIEEWDQVMNVNLKGTWLTCRSVIPYMKKRGKGKVINISSGTAFHGKGERIHYVSSKAAILGFTKTLARELGDDNINVNCIAPGSTLSDENPSQELLHYREKALSSRAIKRVQTADDLLGAVLFLASSQSDFITGQTLIVDGGNHMI